jgi:hypothetical protein
MLLIVGCRPAEGGREDEDAAVRNSLTFTYHRQIGAGVIDQTLAISNAEPYSIVPVLAFTALDRHHHRLPGVRVRTVFGSDRGGLVVSYGWGYDILRFSGPGEHQVYDVRVTVTRVTTAENRGSLHAVGVRPLDAAGHAVSRFSRFAAVRVTNTDNFPVSARVAYIAYDEPAQGDTQQVISVTPIGALVRVPAHGSTVVKVTGDATRAVAKYSGSAVSVKAYNSQ